MVNPAQGEPPEDFSELGIEPWEFFEKHFSPPRMKHYLDGCQNDKDRAKALYTWNTEVSAGFLELLSYLEVALRNCINERMILRHQTKSRTGNWTQDLAQELGRNSYQDSHGKWIHKHPYTDIDVAIYRVMKNNKPVSTEQIVSELPFGFWMALVSQRQKFLWPDVASGFPNTPNRKRENVADLLIKIKDFRNRIGHHHRIWNLDLQVKLDEIYTLAGYIDLQLASWIKSMSRIEEMIRSRP